MAKTKQVTKETKSVIKPLVKVGNEKHQLESLFDGDPELLPEIKSIGYAKISNKIAGWVSYVITTKGKEVISVEVSEPDMRDIAEEMSKLNFVQNFIDHEVF